MEYRVHSHRNALEILQGVKEYESLWFEITQSITALTEELLISDFEEKYVAKGKATKSLSKTINRLLKVELTSRDWDAESYIFGKSTYGDHSWRLDFAKRVYLEDPDIVGDEKVESGISIEVAFNHGGSIAWNLLKPVVASEINHVPKRIQTGVGVVICATKSLKDAGGFDGAIGTYEEFISNLLPLRNILTVPVLIIGLEAPKTFRVVVEKSGNQSFGKIARLS
jgi:hypothetical protein